jgi:hypothetical protein
MAINPDCCPECSDNYVAALDSVSTATMAQYVKFTEHNEWEGETWYFWIPTEGNGGELKALAAALDGEDSGDEKYELDLELVPEYDVDVLVRHSEVGYMATHNKQAGILTLPENLVALLADDDAPFYKGGIRDLMKMSPQ